MSNQKFFVQGLHRIAECSVSGNVASPHLIATSVRSKLFSCLKVRISFDKMLRKSTQKLSDSAQSTIAMMLILTLRSNLCVTHFVRE